MGRDARDGVTGVGTGAGRRELPGRPNVLRLVVGEALDGPSRTAGRTPPACWRRTSTTSTRGCGRGCSPRCWAPGASDAWLTPILMKKGRPGARPRASSRRGVGGRAAAGSSSRTRRAVGLREHDRSASTRCAGGVGVDGVTVGGEAVRVKLGMLGAGRGTDPPAGVGRRRRCRRAHGFAGEDRARAGDRRRARPHLSSPPVSG